jgi:hypothetical protein
MPVTITSGKVKAVISRKTAAAADGLEKIVADVVRKRQEAILQRAKNLWPVDTGRSRDGLHIAETVTTTKVTTNIAYRAPYTLNVHRAGVRILAWEELVMLPVRADEESTGRALADAVIAHLRKW